MSQTSMESRPPRSGSRDRPPRGRSKPSGPRRSMPSSSYTTVCLALGAKDGLKPIDVRNLLKRQGRTRPEDIGRIDMHGHESFVNIASRSVKNALGADGKWYRSFEIFIAKSPRNLDEDGDPR